MSTSNTVDVPTIARIAESGAHGAFWTALTAAVLAVVAGVTATWVTVAVILMLAAAGICLLVARVHNASSVIRGAHRAGGTR